MWTRTVCALLCATSVASCSSSNTNSADINENGFISASEAEAALHLIDQIEIQPGQWDLTEISMRGERQSERTSSGCFGVDEIRQAVRGIALLSFEEEVLAAPDSSCQFTTLEVDASGVAIVIACEIEFHESFTATSTTNLRSQFTPTSFESAGNFVSDDYTQYGLDEGETWTENASISGQRTGGC